MKHSDYLKKKKTRETRKKIISVISAIVVFITTYALVLPAITLDVSKASQEPGIAFEQMQFKTTASAASVTAADSTVEVQVDEAQVEEPEAEDPAEEEVIPEEPAESSEEETSAVSDEQKEAPAEPEQAETPAEPEQEEAPAAEAETEEVQEDRNTDSKSDAVPSSEPVQEEAQTAETQKAAEQTAVDQAGTEATDAAAAATTAETAAEFQIPTLDALDFDDILAGKTAFYYYHPENAEEAENLSSDSVDDWKKAGSDTVLAPEDFVRVYLPYEIPAGALNETNAVARYRLPADLELSDKQIKAINKYENGIAASRSGSEHDKYLGAEAIEGSRTPDEKAGDEYISATVKVEETGDGRQELVFTFIPYTVEKNQISYDEKGNVKSKGKEVKGFFTFDLTTSQIGFEKTEKETVEKEDGTTEEIQHSKAEVVFVKENRDKNIDEISRTLTMVAHAENEEPQAEEQKSLVSEGSDYTVTVSYTESAQIPDNAELSVREIEKDTEEYAAYLEQAKDAVDENKAVNEARFFDITILADGEKVEPQAPVSVQITFAGIEQTNTDDTQLLHYKDTEEVEVMDKAEFSKSEEQAVDTVQFETDGFSVYGIVGTELKTEVTLPGSDDTYEVSVTYGPEAKIPEGATLDVKALAVDSEEYKAAKEAVVAAKKDADAEFDEKDLGFAALDITIKDAQGNPVEPAEGAEVKVSFKMKKLPETASEEALADTLEIQHLNEATGATKVETVAGVQDVTVAEGVAEAEFMLTSFSTFALTWTDGSATIHYGTMDGGDFTEFEEDKVALLDTTASSVSLENNFAGYSFLTAYYVESGSENQIIIDPVLYKQDGKWFADKHITETGSDVTTIQRDEIVNNSDIYVVYTAPQSHPQSGSDVHGPTTTKTVTDNHDGTYTVQLDVEAPVTTETDSQGANVLIILDRTSSMYNRMSQYDSTTRWAAAKSAIETLVTTLKSGDNANNDIDFALMDFYMGVNYWGTAYTSEQETLYRWNNSYWTKDNTSYMSTVNGISLPEQTATCWQLPLNNAQTILSQRDSDQTYVIFITDGEPNCFQYTNGTIYSGSSYPQYMAYYNQLAANGITGLDKVSLYGVFCGSDSGYSTLNNLITNAGGVKTINGTDADGLKAEFANIAHYIVDNLGSKDVSVDDGVPSLSSISAKTAGEASGYEYLKKGPDDTDFQTWDDAPGATYSNDNGVTWDLSAAGTLAKDTTYRLRFTVWPSQEAYDLIADLNNGLVTMSETELHDAGIDFIDGEYRLKTNTHLNTTFTYKGETYTDPSTWHEEEMLLPTETISIKKIWNNPYDPDVHNGGAGVDLYITKDGENYLDGDHAIHVTAVGADGVLDTEDDWISTSDIYISCGLISKDEDGYVVEEAGHDYFVAEPASFAYHWNLTSDVYHPMVINGESAVILIQDDAATGTDGTDYYKIIGSDGEEHKYRVAAEGEDILTATNDRRSYLNLTKTVDDLSTDKAADPDESFEFSCNFTKLTEDVYFSAWADGNYQEMEGSGIAKEIADGSDPSQTPIDDTGWTGYYYASAGSTFTIKLKAGWNIRFINLPVNTEYTITEQNLADGYEFTGAEGSGWNYSTSAADTYTVTVNGQTISGSIPASNHSYTVTAANKYEPSGVELIVNKVWDTGTPAFVTTHGTITVALFRDLNNDGAITADEYISDSERTLTNGTTVTYDKLSSLEGIVVREVTISTETTGEGDEAVTTKTVTPIVPSGQISVSGETTTAGSGATNTYVVTYAPGTESDNSRTDVVTNTLVKTPIELTKIGDWTVGTTLSDVQFKVYSDAECTEQLTVDSVGNAIGTNGLITTGADGKATVGTFIQGTYYLQEVKGADGYNMLSEAVAFTINADGSVTYSTGNSNFDVTPGSTYETDDGVGLYISNPSGAELPMTGGPGTLPYTLGGIALIMASALMYGFRMRRRERRLN